MAENNNKDFPFEIKDVDSELATELSSKFTGETGGFVRVGPKGYFFAKKYVKEASLYYNMAVRPSDVFVVTYPRSGTTMTQELVWMVGNDLDYKKAADEMLIHRFPYLDFGATFDTTPEHIKSLMEKFKGNEEVMKELRLISRPMTENLRDAPSPRFIKTHLPLSLLPPVLSDTARVIYVARDPRDVAVSFFHISRLLTTIGFNGDFKTYWNYFIKDLTFFLPYFEHIKEGWEKRHHPNVLFLFYEQLTKDMPGTIRRVAKFLGKSITDEQEAKLVHHLRIDNFKNNKSVDLNFFRDIGFLTPDEQPFIRRGKVGGWRDYFDEEMTRQAEHWIAENLRGTDLRFPGMDEP